MAGADGPLTPAPAPEPEEVNPPPEQMATAVFLLREVAALFFVGCWLAMYAWGLVSGAYQLPLWFHGIGVSCLAYALGLNVAQLVYKPGGPGVAGRAARRALERRREG